jgi:hypothetical protein
MVQLPTLSIFLPLKKNSQFVSLGLKSRFFDGKLAAMIVEICVN